MMDRVSAARRALVLDHPFFGVLSLKLELIEDGSGSTKTLKTDGKRLWFNPSYVATLNQNQLVGVVAHEVLHCSNGHPWRREHRDPREWNEAADLAVNPIVLDAGMSLPSGTLDGSPYRGMSAEEIYARRQQEKQQQQMGQSAGTGQHTNAPQAGCSGQVGDVEEDDFGCGEIVDCEDHEIPQMQADWSASVLHAAKQAQAMGRLPKGMERLVQEIKNPPQDWRTLLRRFVQQNAASDYSWLQPNTRYLSMGLYLPSLRSENMPPMVVAIDTSGSIDDLVLSQFAREVNAIVQEMQPQAVHVLYCDTRIQAVDVFEQGEQISISPKGGGGTDFKPVFNWLEEQGLQPSCLVYLTDMAGRFPISEPDYPVLWGDTEGRYPAPWGETVQIRCN